MPLSIFIIDIPASIKWFLIIFICISLMTEDPEHFFVSFLDICMFLWRTVCSDPLPVFQLDYCLSTVEL